MEAPRGRVERHRPQLHLRHHRRSQRRRLPSSWRLSQRTFEYHRLGNAAARGVSVDAADVSLQRLVLPLDHGRQCRHQHLSPQGRGEAGAGCNPDPQGHALLRRADRARDADQRAGGLEKRHQAQGELPGCRRGATGIGHRGHAANRLRHHSRLRLDRNLRPRGSVRQACRVGCTRHRGPDRAQWPSRRALYLPGRHDGDGCGNDDAGALGRRNDGRDHVSRQYHHEGLPQESQDDARDVCRRLVPLRRSRGHAARRLCEDQGPVQGCDHFGW